jgi:hypothetical protein
LRSFSECTSLLRLLLRADVSAVESTTTAGTSREPPGVHSGSDGGSSDRVREQPGLCTGKREHVVSACWLLTPLCSRPHLSSIRWSSSMARSILPDAVLLLLLLFIHEGRCQPSPSVLDRAPPLPLPAMDPSSLEGEVQRVAGQLTDEVQRKYGFCVADVYVLENSPRSPPYMLRNELKLIDIDLAALIRSFRAKDLNETFNFEADPSFASECMQQTRGTSCNSGQSPDSIFHPFTCSAVALQTVEKKLSGIRVSNEDGILPPFTNSCAY